MKIKGKQTIYPYISIDGIISLRTYHTEKSYLGIVMLDEDDGIPLEYEVEVDTKKTVNELAVVSFNKRIEKVRAESQVKVEELETEKQRFLALEASA